MPGICFNFNDELIAEGSPNRVGTNVSDFHDVL